MRQFATSITIHSDPVAIWALLTDAAGYPQWNSTVEKIDGRIAAGEKMTLYAKVSPGRPFALRVTEFMPPQKMTWAGGLPLALFTGTRSFALRPAENGAVGFAMSETYHGPLAALITRMLPNLQPEFDRFAADLKRCAETQASYTKRRND